MNQKRHNDIGELEKLLDSFNNTLENANTISFFHKKAFEIMIEIEDKVNSILTNSRKKTIIEKKEIFERYLKMYGIQLDYKNIETLLDEVILKTSDILNKSTHKLDYSIFPQKDINIESNGGQQNNFEVRTALKFQGVLKALYNLGYEVISNYEETLETNRMRKNPYKIIYVEKEKSKKTVLVSDQIGEATFIFDGHINVERFLTTKKGENIDGLKPISVIYNTNYVKRLITALSFDGTDIITDNKSIEEQEAQETKENEELTLEKIKDYFYNYEGLSKEESFEKLIKLTQKEIRNLSIKGKKITTIVNKSGFDKPDGFNSQTLSDFKLWLYWLFEKQDELKEREEDLNLENIRAYFYNYEGLSKEDSFKRLKELTIKEILNLSIKGKKITTIVNKSGFDKPDGFNSQTLSDFKLWLYWLFEKQDELKEREEDLNLEKIRDYFYNYEGLSKEESFEKLKELTTKEIKNLSINGQKIITIVTKSGFNKPEGYYTKNSSDFKIWLYWIFDKNDENEELTLESIKEYFYNYEGLSKEGSFEKLIKLTQRKIPNISIKGKKIITIVNKSGFDKPVGFRVHTSSDFKIWLYWLFDKNDEYERLLKERQQERLLKKRQQEKLNEIFQLQQLGLHFGKK